MASNKNVRAALPLRHARKDNAFQRKPHPRHRRANPKGELISLDPQRTAKKRELFALFFRH